VLGFTDIYTDIVEQRFRQTLQRVPVARWLLAEPVPARENGG